MSLFYREEHKTCYNYKLATSTNFELLHFQESKVPQEINVDSSVLIFLLSGEVLVTCNNFQDKLHKEGEIALLPRNSCCYVKIIRECTIISCAFIPNINFCNRFSLHQLVDFIPKKFTYEFTILPMRERISQFLALLRNCLEDGLECVHFHELKEQELFLLLRAYYSKEELATFFYPLIGKDVDFKEFILSNYLSITDLNDFAQRANMSIDTFKRRFKEVYGESAHKWITQRKAEQIYRDIILTQNTLTEIATKYRMSSQAYLTTFCKQHFGKTPQELRNNI